MRTDRIGSALLTAVLAMALLSLPATAFANSLFIERGLVGTSSTQHNYPAIGGDNVIFGALSPEPGSVWVLRRFNIATGLETAFHSGTDHALGSRISGDWVVWQQNHDIKAKNIKTGAFKNVTNDGDLTDERMPDVSGTYVVYWFLNGAKWDVRAKNLATTASPSTLAGGDGNQFSPSIYGKRVAYVDDADGHGDVLVKTIGSSAAPTRITDDGLTHWSPSIGDHLIAWVIHNATGKDRIQYFDYNTGETTLGPTDDMYDILNVRVSGDRILYNVPNGADQDLYVFDTRMAKVADLFASFKLAGTGDDEEMGAISGNEVVYIAGASPIWGRLAVPSISVSAVPSRIAHGGHIHLKGSISDQGHRIGSASIGIEKYVSGAWKRVKTFTASSTGTFSYQTPKTYSKTPYRVVYDGRLAFMGAPALTHLSAVSGVKYAWPR
jgi:hypothetical protein